MSRGFVKEDDQEEAPFIPPRAVLPDGVENYVTPRGLAMLHEERAELEAERKLGQESDDARRRANAVVDGKMDLLDERIASARLVEPVRTGEAGALRDHRARPVRWPPGWGRACLHHCWRGRSLSEGRKDQFSSSGGAGADRQTQGRNGVLLARQGQAVLEGLGDSQACSVTAALLRLR